MSKMRFTNKSGSLKKSSGSKFFGKPSTYKSVLGISIRSQSTVKYKPTYRLEPKIRFNRDICRRIMRNIMERSLYEFKYSPKNAQKLSKYISDEIQSRIKLQDYDRYKMICLVTIGEKFSQSFCSAVRFLWDANMDEYVNEVYDTPNFFCITTLFAIYYD